MTADQCDFEHEGYCIPSKDAKGFVCPNSVAVGDLGLRECHGKNEDLMTEEEYDEMIHHSNSMKAGVREP